MFLRAKLWKSWSAPSCNKLGVEDYGEVLQALWQSTGLSVLTFPQVVMLFSGLTLLFYLGIYKKYELSCCWYPLPLGCGWLTFQRRASWVRMDC